MYVCICMNVTETRIKQAIESGASTLEEIQFITTACTNCHSCEPFIELLLQEHKNKQVVHKL